MSRLDTYKDRFKAAVTKIEASLRRQRWKEAFIFSAFILLALGFWLLVSLQQEYETELAIPVVYRNVPPDVSFSEKRPEKILVRVKDKGSALLNYSLKGQFTPLVVDMEGVSEKEGTFTVSREQIEAAISKQVLATSSYTGFTPQEIRLQYSPVAGKDVPVRFNGQVTTKPGFLVSGDIRITPSLVRVYATQELLDSIQEVKTVYTEIVECTKTVTRNLELEALGGVNFEAETVSVVVPVEEYTEKSLRIPVVCEGIPAQYIVRTFPPEIEVTCNLPVSRFKDLTADDLAIHIPYKDLEQVFSGIIPVDLTKKPEWIHAYTLNPGKIEFILEKKSY